MVPRTHASSANEASQPSSSVSAEMTSAVRASTLTPPRSRRTAAHSPHSSKTWIVPSRHTATSSSAVGPARSLRKGTDYIKKSAHPSWSTCPPKPTQPAFGCPVCYSFQVPEGLSPPLGCTASTPFAFATVPPLVGRSSAMVYFRSLASLHPARGLSHPLPHWFGRPHCA